MQKLEERKRSLVKSVTYRALSMSVDMAVAYYFTREASLSVIIVLIVNGYSTALYYLHERIWVRIKWGRVHP